MGQALHIEWESLDRTVDALDVRIRARDEARVYTFLIGHNLLKSRIPDALNDQLATSRIELWRTDVTAACRHALEHAGRFAGTHAIRVRTIDFEEGMEPRSVASVAAPRAGS